MKSRVNIALTTSCRTVRSQAALCEIFANCDGRHFARMSRTLHRLVTRDILGLQTLWADGQHDAVAMTFGGRHASNVSAVRRVHAFESIGIGAPGRGYKPSHHPGSGSAAAFPASPCRATTVNNRVLWAPPSGTTRTTRKYSMIILYRRCDDSNFHGKCEL
jgi:hypothetical protein